MATRRCWAALKLQFLFLIIARTESLQPSYFFQQSYRQKLLELLVYQSQRREKERRSKRLHAPKNFNLVDKNFNLVGKNIQKVSHRKESVEIYKKGPNTPIHAISKYQFKRFF